MQQAASERIDSLEAQLAEQQEAAAASAAQLLQAER